MSIDEPFEYLSFGSTFRRTFHIFYERWDVFLCLSSIVVLPYFIMILSIRKFISNFYIKEEEIPEFHPNHIPMIVFVLTIQLAAYTIITIVGRAAIIRVVCLLFYLNNDNNNQSDDDRLVPIVWTSLKFALSKNKFCQLFSANILIYLCVLMGLFIPIMLIWSAILVPSFLSIILAIIALLMVVFGGVYVYVGVVLTNPTIVVEENFRSTTTTTKRGPIPYIQRSWELSIGSKCYIFCCLFVLFIFNNLTTRILHNLFDSGSNDNTTVMDILLSVTGVITQTLPMIFFFPLHAILETVIYLNLRIGRESMNHQILSGDLMMSTTVAAGGGITTTTTTNNNNDYRPVSIISGGSTSATNTASSSSMIGQYRNVPLMDTDDIDESITFEHPPPTTTTTTTTTMNNVISEMV